MPHPMPQPHALRLSNGDGVVDSVPLAAKPQNKIRPLQRGEQAPQDDPFVCCISQRSRHDDFVVLEVRRVLTSLPFLHSALASNTPTNMPIVASALLRTH